MMNKISVKVALWVNGILLVVIACGTLYLVNRQNSNLENQFLEKAEILSQIGAKAVGRVLNEAIDNDALSFEEVFDIEYTVIPGFDPPKYHTSYDSYLDKAILDIQDVFLNDSNIDYAVAMDRNGYVPTHNTRFQQPLTGNREKDLIHNRTKRIYNDPIAKSASQNEKQGFRQEYARDTGKIMWDVSSPVYVKNRHWGSFRTGFSLDDLDREKKRAMAALFVIMSFVFIVSVFAVFLTVNQALKPLSVLTLRAASLADGDVEAEITAKGRDEIGQLADVLERLRVSLKTAMDRIRRK